VIEERVLINTREAFDDVQVLAGSSEVCLGACAHGEAYDRFSSVPFHRGSRTEFGLDFLASETLAAFEYPYRRLSAHPTGDELFGN
jgi:hypothetical protein